MMNEITVTAVDGMFAVVADEFAEANQQRNAQKKWTAVKHELRRRVRRLLMELLQATRDGKTEEDGIIAIRVVVVFFAG